MHDRAVVARYRYQIGSSGYWVECDAKEAVVVYPDGHEEPYIGINIGEASEPAPRALVAISEDQQWLVRYHRGILVWVIYDECHWGYQEYASVEETGQDAHEVLREWLEG